MLGDETLWRLDRYASRPENSERFGTNSHCQTLEQILGAEYPNGSSVLAIRCQTDATANVAGDAASMSLDWSPPRSRKSRFAHSPCSASSAL